MTEIVSAELAADLLARGHAVRLLAGGGSMRPFLRPGTAVTIEPVADPSFLRVGDVAFIKSGGLPMLHRVVRPSPRLRTKGDALGHFDPFPEAVLGRVVGQGGFGGRALAILSCLMQPLQLAFILFRQLVIKACRGRASEIA